MFRSRTLLLVAGLLVPLPAVSQFTLKGTGVTASDFTSPLSPQG